MESFATAGDVDQGRILIVGATGIVGRGLAQYFRRHVKAVVETSRRSSADPNVARFDLLARDFSSLRLEESRYRCAVLCAGVTKADVCEASPSETRAVNVEGTLALIERLFAADVMPVFLSSDYVFDGLSSGLYDETSPVRPLNAYGGQKVEVEQALASSGRPHLVVRPGRVVTDHQGGECILDEACARLLSGAEYRAASDQVFGMVFVEDLARLIEEALRQGLQGVMHAAAPQAVTRYDLVCRLAEGLGISSERVQACRLGDVPGAATRPLRTAMASKRATRELGFSFTDPSLVMARMIASYMRNR